MTAVRSNLQSRCRRFETVRAPTSRKHGGPSSFLRDAGGTRWRASYVPDATSAGMDGLTFLICSATSAAIAWSRPLTRC